MRATEAEILAWMAALVRSESTEAVAFASTNILVAFRKRDEEIAVLRATLAALQTARGLRAVRP